ncbi:MAG: hypothetical protein ACP5NG_03650 [Conexivisphaera sp.]
MRTRDAAAVVLAVALMFALSWFPAGALIAGLVAGILEGNAARGFFAALGAGLIYALALTALAAGEGPVAVAFEFYYAYVVDTVACSIGGLLGGWAYRRFRRSRGNR